MTIGDRIRERLEVTGMSQSELARRVKLTQGTIGGLIIGKARSSAHLHKIARELGTNAAYLTGETDDPDAESAPPPLDADTREMVEHFAVLSSANRRALLTLARSLVAVARTADAPQ